MASNASNSPYSRMGQSPQLSTSNAPYSSIFDSYAQGIRGNLVRGTSDAVDSISACDALMQTSTILSYAITILVIVLFIGVAFSFNYVFLVVLGGIVTIVSVYQSIIMSNKNCNGLFGGWFSG